MDRQDILRNQIDSDTPRGTKGFSFAPRTPSETQAGCPGISSMQGLDDSIECLTVNPPMGSGAPVQGSPS